MLRIFDAHVDNVQDAIAHLKTRNVNTDEAEAKLKAFVALKPELVAALNSGDKDQIRQSVQNMQQKWLDVKQAIMTARRLEMMGRALGRADNVLAALDRNIARLKERGIDTSGLEDRRDAIAAKINETRMAIKESSGLQADVLYKQLNSSYSDTMRRHEETKRKASVVAGKPGAGG